MKEPLTWNRILTAVLHMPGVKVDRTAFLRKALSDYCNDSKLDLLSNVRPYAIVPDKVIDRVAKTVINRTQRKENPDQPVHVSMELPTVKVKENPQPRRPEKREAKKERRDDNRQQAKKAPVQKNARRPQNRRPEQPSSEVKNVTVRTFGKKKKEQEESK